MSRNCDAVQCSADIQSGRFLCIKHWRMVPIQVQHTINTRFRACRADFGFLSDIAYLQACVDAIEGIASLEGKDLAPTTYHRMLASEKRKAAQKEIGA
jgi:hypothetical protein